MNRHASARRRRIRLTLVYILMVCAIFGLVTALVFFMLGYRFNQSNGMFTQGGLVQFGSNPSGASVRIDNKLLGSQTATQQTIASGSHTFAISKAGYQTWQKTLSVMPGSVLWLNYDRLVPNKLTPSSVASYQTVTSALASPNDSHMAIVTKADEPKITLVNISGDTTKSITITIPSEDLTMPANPAANQSFTITNWSGNSRYFLVEHSYDTNQVEWLRIDSQGQNVVQNITTKFALAFSDLEFRPSDSSQLYSLTPGGDLRLIDLGAGTISAPLESGVAEFTVTDDGMLTYTSQYDAKTRVRTVGYISDGASNGQILRSYTDDGTSPLHIATGVYYGTRYAAISYGKTLDLLQADLPNSGNTDGTSKLQLIGSFNLPTGSTRYLTMRTNGRFVIAQDGANVSVYDIELGSFTTMKFGALVPLRWLDGYIAWSDAGNILQIIDFDGTNQHIIMPVVSGLDATLSSNGKYFYGFTHGKNGHVDLSRVQMIIR